MRVAAKPVGLLVALCIAAPLSAKAPPTPSCPLGDEPRSELDTLIRGGIVEHVVSQKKKDWERALGGEAAAKPHIKARLRGWPGRLLADKNRLPADGTAFARRLARDTWRGLDLLSDRENGLPVNTVFFADGALEVPGARIGDYASSTDIGLHLVAVVAAAELGFIDRAAALERVRQVLATLARLETHRGFFFNYYDTTSLERTSNFISFVDSSWLTAGLLVVRNALPEAAAAATALIERMEYELFYDAATRTVSHGYYVTPGFRSPYDYGVLYTEARLGSLIAIGKGDVPEAHWFEMARTYPPACRGQTRSPIGVRRRRVRGHDIEAGYYEWKGVRYVPSWGGSMFEALMPLLLLDEQRLAPKSLGANAIAHATLQRRYALEELGYPVWGLSPSATPHGDDYHEYGARILGMRGYGGGAVTPHAAALALLATPEAALINLRALAERYDMYGELGFYDAVDPRSGAVVYKYLALDQAMLFIALANHLNDGCIQKRFAADPIVQRILPLIAEEGFFE